MCGLAGVVRLSGRPSGEEVGAVLAMLDAKHANGGLDPAETEALEVATLRLYGAGASPKKFARLEAQQVDGVLRGQ